MPRLGELFGTEPLLADGPAPDEDDYMPRRRQLWIGGGALALALLLAALGIAIAALVLAAGAEPKHGHHQTPDIVGWWLVTSRSTFSDRFTAIEIYEPEHSNGGHRLAGRLYAGIPGQLREWTPLDYDAGRREADFTTPNMEFLRYDSSPQHWMAVWDNFEPFNLTQAFKETLLHASVTQPHDVLYFAINQVPEAPISENYLYRLDRLPGRPDIAPYADITYRENTNPQRILRYFWGALTMISAQLHVAAQPREYPGYAGFEATLDSLLTTGVARSANVTDVWRSRPDIGLIFASSICTTLVTDVYSNPLMGERFIVSGFTSTRGYDVLNGDWKQTDWPQTGGPVGDIYLPSHFVGSRFTYTTNVATNTSELPPYDASIDGNATVYVYVPAVTAETGPYDLVGAATVLLRTSGYTTHSWIRVWSTYVANFGYTMLDTIAELAASLATSDSFRALGSGIRYTHTTVGTWIYTNVANQYIYGCVELNDPTGLDPLAFFDYDIVRNNYLDEDATFATYWEVTGECNPALPITCNMVDTTGGYYLNNGDAFAYITVPLADGNPNASRYSYAGHHEGDFVTGLISPARSGGMPIGYLYQREMLAFDRIFKYSQFQEFSPPGTPPTLAPFYDGFASALENLMSYEPECMIIDNIWNNGGSLSYIQVLASFFGANRSAFVVTAASADNGYGPTTAFVDIGIDGELPATVSGEVKGSFIDAAYAALTYPTAVFRGNGKTVVVMQGIMSVSAGDIFPHLFRNLAGPDYGDIGDGVRSRIVGDCDGRLFGAAGGQRQFPVNTANNLFTVAGLPTTPFFGFNIENFGSLAYTANTSAYISNQLPPTAPDVLLSSDIRDMLWLDTGASGELYPRNPLDGGSDANVLPLAAGVTDAPSPVDPTTWRHRTLEAAIMQCGAWSDSRRRTVVQAETARTTYYPLRTLDDVRAANAARLDAMPNVLAAQADDVLLAKLREAEARNAAAYRHELLGLHPLSLELYLDRRARSAA